MPAEKHRNLAVFPLDPARLPVFYGWAVLVMGILGTFASLPGQTVGVSVFTDFLIEELGITRSRLSLAYLFGTVMSALLLPRAGRVFDKRGARFLGTAAAAGLAGSLIYMSATPGTSRILSDIVAPLGSATAGFLVITVGFFLIRFFGQGCMALASRNMVMVWFDKRRGFVNAFFGMSLSLGFSLSPRVFEAFIASRGWQGAWRTIAFIIAGFALLAFMFFRNRPEEHGLVPDGRSDLVRGEKRPQTTSSHDFTLAEARRTYAFWIVSLTLFMGALLVTATTFHIVSVFADAGMSRGRAVGVFVPIAVVSVSFQFIGSLISDFIKLKYLVMIQLTGIVLLSLALIALKPGVPYWALVVGSGINNGLFGILTSLTWPRYFGRRHVGAVSGMALSLTVAGSAVGPLLFSLGRDLTGGYRAAGIVCLAAAVILLAGSIPVDRPRIPSERRGSESGSSS